jgi:hypothetical protein
VLVLQVQTSVTVSPTDTAILTGGNAQFTATAVDQFGNAMTPQQPFTWSLGDGVGNLFSGGPNSKSATYTAPTSGGSESVTLTVWSGGTAAAANVAVVWTPSSNWIPDSAASVGSNSVNSPYNVTLASAAMFTFQDDSQGNVFKVYDNGALVLTTTLVNGEAYGQAMLAAGANALTINWVSRGQPGNNGDGFSYCINQETLLGLTVWDNCSNNNQATAIADGAAKTLTVAGVPSANDPTTMTASVCVIPGWTSNTDTNRVYVSIKRESDGGQPDQSLYYGPLSQFGQEDWTLTTNSQAVDFVIREWVDGNEDGQFDAGDDSREVDVRVLTPWSAVGTWTAGHAAMVEANADGASLSQLALDITGSASDAWALGNVGTVVNGKQVDVTGLINLLDARIRANVVAAASAAKTAGFGNPSYNATNGYPQYSWTRMNEVRTTSIFNGTAPRDSAGNPLVKYDYKCMALIELAYGVIQVLQPGEFDKLGLTPACFANDSSSWRLDPVPVAKRLFVDYNTPSAAQLEGGDAVRFANFPGYLLSHGGYSRNPGSWNSEYTIKSTDPSDGSQLYYGWNIPGPQTESQWKEELLHMYNNDPAFPLLDQQKIGLQDVPGYQGDAWFIDVPRLAEMIFGMRTSQP